MDSSNDPDDEIGIDPLPMPRIPMPSIVPAITGRLRRELLVEGNRRPTRQGWLAGVIAAVILIGALKLTGVIWTTQPPAWVPALGPHVTVTGPDQVAPGQGSPGAVLAGALAALSSQDPGAACKYLYQAGPRCTAQFSQAPRNQLPYAVSVKVSYVAIDGTQALVGFTGKICSPGNTPECVTNTDPAAIFSGGDTFTTLWTQTTGPTYGNSGYSLQPCSKTGGKWYLGTGASTDSSYASRVNAPSRQNGTQRSRAGVSAGLADLG